ncbi:MAG: sugar MFS transporter [Alloprevotella sp.]|nr:sugar MFS transporter [Alloprevotella sp.]
MNNAQPSRGSLFSVGGKNYLMPFILVTALFFLWGFAHSILDVLNKHFQEAFDMTKTRSALVQAMVYGGYFLMALPAGLIIRRWGYRAGVCAGLGLYGIGALMFVPGSQIGSFEFFLLSLFVIGCGLTCLETAANPYVTVLGDDKWAERRINIAQSFNGLGWIIGPVVGGLCVLGSGNIALPYAVVGIVVLLILGVFVVVKLPEVASTTDAAESHLSPAADRPLLRQRHFLFGLVALFFYVAAQTGINSFFINYAEECAGVDKNDAALWLGFLGMGLFMLGRMGGSFLMKYLSPERLLLFFSIGATMSMLVIMTLAGTVGFYAFFVCFLCESIMFPTIFALAIRGLGRHTKMASSLLIMCIVGGAVAPLLMGFIADVSGIMSLSFSVPLLCFAVIAIFALTYRSCLAGIGIHQS